MPNVRRWVEARYLCGCVNGVAWMIPPGVRGAKVTSSPQALWDGISNPFFFGKGFMLWSRFGKVVYQGVEWTRPAAPGSSKEQTQCKPDS